jgi:ribokinase
VTSPPRIAVVGSAMTDMVVRMERIPESGETLLGTSFAVGRGGKGANQAVMAALFGAQVHMVGCVGDDSFGADTIASFAEAGVDTTLVRRVADVPTGVAPIWVEATGENRIVIVPGANLHLGVGEVDTAFDRLGAVDVVVCQLEIPLDCVERAFARGRESGAITILNPAPFAPVPQNLLALADWIVPNEVEFAALSGRAAAGDNLSRDVAALGDRLGTGLVVTLGSRGALLHAVGGDGVPTTIPARTATVLDTTGAGDAFVGAFAFALGRGSTPAVAAEFACACASSSVERAGTQSSFPQGAELDTLKSMLEVGALRGPR